MKCWFLIQSDNPPASALRSRPPLDTEAADRLARGIFGPVRRVGTSNLVQHADPRDGRVAIGVYGSTTIIAAESVIARRLADLDRVFLSAAAGRQTFLFALHSMVGLGAFAWWDGDGNLIRAIGGGDGEILEDLGTPLPFEAGARVDPADVDEFTPEVELTELVECALAELAGFRFEGAPHENAIDPEEIALVVYEPM
jgi:hypothetical protein